MSIYNLQQRAAIFLAVVLSLGSARSQAWPQNETAPPPAGTATDSSPASSAFSEETMNKLLDFYGAVLVARGGAIPPPGIVFADEAAVTAWQAGVPLESATMGKETIELQTPAMQALLAASAEVQELRLAITPRPPRAARRNYAVTVRFWRIRVNSGLAHWVKKGRITAKEARHIRALAPGEQVATILRLEADGLYFSSNFKKSILASGAPPGASQHLSMLALDIREHDHVKIRAALARHGWFQTVPADLSHFTFLGCREDELLALGLKKITQGQRVYWVLDRAAATAPPEHRGAPPPTPSLIRRGAGVVEGGAGLVPAFLLFS